MKPSELNGRAKVGLWIAHLCDREAAAENHHRDERTIADAAIEMNDQIRAELKACSTRCQRAAFAQVPIIHTAEEAWTAARMAFLGQPVLRGERRVRLSGWGRR